MAEVIKRAVCHLCKSRCRVLVHVENGRLVDVEEDTSFPTAGSIFPPFKACVRMRAVKEFMYHPDRLNFPLKRAGEKGEGKWQVISWDQALDEMADKLKQIKEEYGPEALAVTTGTGRGVGEEIGVARFMNLFGSPNTIGQMNICWGVLMSVGQAIFGWPVRYVTARTVGGEAGKELVTKCSLLIGVNPAQSFMRTWKYLRDAKKLGQKIVVIDPRRTETVELADLWLQPRPGTDVALLMSMINVIIEEGLYDKDFVDRWCYGFDKLAERAREYPPEKVAEITWVPAEKIKEAARMYATNKPAAAINGMGIEQAQQAVEVMHARYILLAITGNLDIEGGEYLPGPGRLVPWPELVVHEALSPEQKKKQLGRDRFRFMSWASRDLMQEHIKKTWGIEAGISFSDATAHDPSVYRAAATGKPYPVKAIISVWSNPMVTPANTKLVYKALKNLELYVVADYFMTPSAQLADYVLPAKTWLERPFMADHCGYDNQVRFGEAALPDPVPGEYDRKTDYDLFCELGIRLGQSWPWKSLEEVFEYRLTPLGVSFEEFMDQGGYDFPPPEYKKCERVGFGTPTGKVELYSTVFEKLGYDPLPRYEETFENPVSTPELAKEYPLMLITGGRFNPLFHSEFRQIDSLRRKRPDPLVQVNPETAKKLDIQDGDWVWIETLRGKIRMKCKFFTGIDPRVVHAEHGWWFPELPAEEPWLSGVFESNVNVLTNDDPDVCDKLSGGWPLKTALCKIYKCKKY